MVPKTTCIPSILKYLKFDQTHHSANNPGQTPWDTNAIARQIEASSLLSPPPPPTPRPPPLGVQC